MNKFVRGLLALGLLTVLAVAAAGEDDKGGMVDNPKYKFWANFKPGTTSTYHEVTTFTGAEKENLPGGKDEKTIVYRLANVNKDRVVVVTTVIEEEYLGTVESAPTKLTYPAKVKKANLEAALEEFGAKKTEDETVKVGKEEIKCKVLAGTTKRDGGTLEYKLHYSDTVPGGVVKRTRVTKSGDKVVAETIVTLRSFAMPKVKDKKDKDKAKESE
jgi:hypothetical protein